jgi:hypothetical protein
VILTAATSTKNRKMIRNENRTKRVGEIIQEKGLLNLKESMVMNDGGTIIELRMKIINRIRVNEI